jgi:hypothetical protein
MDLWNVNMRRVSAVQENSNATSNHDVEHAEPLRQVHLLLLIMNHVGMTGTPVGTGSSLYLDFSQVNADFQILVDGRSADLGGLNNCTYNGPIKLNATTAQIEIIVNGAKPGGSGGANTSGWFFEFNNLMYALAILSGHRTNVDLALLNW